MTDAIFTPNVVRMVVDGYEVEITLSGMVTVEPEPCPEPAPTFGILYSTTPERSNPVPLDGQTVVGNIHVFTSPDTGASSVAFYLDDPTRVGAPVRTENTPPFDFKGGTVSTANPFNTTTVANGAHTITAAITLTDTTVNVVHASFTVAN